MNAMNDPLNSKSITRRDALRAMSCGFGFLALKGMAGATPFAPQDLLAAKAPMLPARAKRVIFLCMSGAPSHVDTFDYKPELSANSGKTLSGYRRGAKLLGSPFKFDQHGDSGLWISELFPKLAKHADDLCLLKGMHTELPAHPQAQTMLHTGSIQFVRPSMGAWSLYGLGTENTNLPGFVTINPQGGRAQLFGSAFLPATYQGLKIGVNGQGGGRRGQAREPVEDIKNPRQNTKLQRKQLDLVQKLNKEYAKREKGDDGIDAVIQSL